MATSEQKKLHIILIEDNPNYRKVLREALDDSEYVTIGNDLKSENVTLIHPIMISIRIHSTCSRMGHAT